MGAADSTGAIYQTNRLGGGFEYKFGPAEGLAAGHNYTVTLLFCELYFDSPGQRLFSVTANRNKSLLTNLDIYYAAGAYPCATSWCKVAHLRPLKVQSSLQRPLRSTL